MRRVIIRISSAMVVVTALSACGGTASTESVWTRTCGTALPRVSDDQIGTPVPSNASVVLADVSQSTLDRRGEFQEGLCATAQKIIDEGGQLWGGWITSSGVQRFANLGTFDFTPLDSSCENDLVCRRDVQDHRAELADKVAAWIQEAVDARQEGAGTDVASALEEAVRALRAFDDSACRRIVLFSDMAQRHLGDDVIGDSVDVEDLADLSGIRVQVVGAGATTAKISAEEAQQIKAYWDAYFLAASADYSPDDYGPTFLGLAVC